MKKISALFILALLLYPGPGTLAVAAELEDKLVEAAGKGDAATVHTMLEMGADVNGRVGIYGETALMSATEYIEVVRILLDKGADINAKSENGDTALMVAAYGNEDVVRLLLDRGADVNAKDSEGNTVLMNASRFGSPAIFQLLLARGADVNAKNNDGTTALMNAAFNGNADATRILLENGADVNAKLTEYGDTALISAAGRGHADVVRLLIEKGANLSARDNDGKTALMSATEKIEKGNWGAVGKDGKMAREPLSPEEKKRYDETVRLLKEATARPNVPDTDKPPFNRGVGAPGAAKYECPKTRYINCMPPVKDGDRAMCSEDYLEWVKSHCDGVEVVY